MNTQEYRYHSLRRVAAYLETNGQGPPDVLAIAPGRVNVIGEHVDYNGGWVLPAAIERCASLAMKRRGDGLVTLHSDNLKPAVASFAISDGSVSEGRCWSNYVKGVIAGLRERGYDVPGFDVCLSSDIPIGGGLSSSAALEAVFAIAALRLMGETMDPLEMAKLCQKAEHDYAGVPCGLMDQAAVILCQEDHLLLLDCENETYQHARFDDPAWQLLIINSGVAHELADGEYAKRRASCHKAAAVLGVPSLRHVPFEDLASSLEAKGLDEEMRRCARHVVTENHRTLALVKALDLGDYAEAGKLLNASHRSLSEDYRVSCDELDFIASLAQKLEGVAGCRITGGGFGGSAIALARSEKVDTVTDAIESAYRDRYDRQAGIFATRPMAGAMAWHWDASPLA